MASKKHSKYEVFAPDLVLTIEAKSHAEAKEKADRFCKLMGFKMWAVSLKEE